MVQYLERSFLIISYFGVAFTSAFNSILFCCLRHNVEPAHGRPWLCTARDRAWSVSHCTWSSDTCSQQKPYHYNTQYLLYPRPLRWWNFFFAEWWKDMPFDTFDRIFFILTQRTPKMFKMMQHISEHRWNNACCILKTAVMWPNFIVICSTACLSWQHFCTTNQIRDVIVYLN